MGPVVKRAVIYTRQSQDRDGDFLAVERQRAECRKYATERGWRIVRIIADNDVSASRGHRPGYAEVLKLIEARQCDVVVCWHMDRLTRRLTELEHLIEMCEHTGVRVATVSGDIDLSTDSGRLVGRILASVARGEVERKAARQRLAHAQAAANGKVPMRRAFGYQTDGTLHPIEAPAVAEAFDKLLAGGSIKGITTWLNRAGHTTTRGHAWDRTSVRKMLMNVRYAGIRTLRGVEIGPGEWEPIVAEEIVRATIDMLGDPGRRLNVSRARKWIGARLYRCGKCDNGVMVVTYDHGKHRQYRCENCFAVRRADRIDDLVCRVVVAKLRSEDIGELMASTSPDVRPLRTEARALRRRISGLADDVSMPESVLRRRVSALQARLEEVTAELAEAGRASALAKVLNAPDPGQVWIEMDDIVARQAVIRECFTITLKPGIAGRRPFDPQSVRFGPPEA